MGFKEELEKRKLLLAQKEQEKKTQQKKLPLAQEQKAANKPEMVSEGKSINMTLDGIRGLFLIATGIGDKKSNKIILEQKLKEILLTPMGFGSFMENIAKYLKTVQ